MINMKIIKMFFITLQIISVLSYDLLGTASSISTAAAANKEQGNCPATYTDESSCLAKSDSSTDCCTVTMGITIPGFGAGTGIKPLCLGGKKTTKSIDYFSLKSSLINVDLKCKANTVPAVTATSLNTCTAATTASGEACSKLSSNGVQCCYINYGVPGAAAAFLEDIKTSFCAGVYTDFTMPSYQTNMMGTIKYSLICNGDAQTVTDFDKCTNLSPTTEADCLTMSTTKNKCKFVKSTTNGVKDTCVAYSGDMTNMRVFNLDANLNTVNFDAAVLTSDSITLKYTFTLLLSLLLLAML